MREIAVSSVRMAAKTVRLNNWDKSRARSLVLSQFKLRHSPEKNQRSVNEVENSQWT